MGHYDSCRDSENERMVKADVAVFLAESHNAIFNLRESVKSIRKMGPVFKFKGKAISDIEVLIALINAQQERE